MKLLKNLAIPVLAAIGLFAQSSPNFTGGNVTPVTENNTGTIVKFRFPPGVRTKWHTHSIGQIIMCEEGVALVQRKGGPVIELGPGQTLYVSAGVVHWHGAAPDRGGVQFNVTRGENLFTDEVSEADYHAKPVKLTLP